MAYSFKEPYLGDCLSRADPRILLFRCGQALLAFAVSVVGGAKETAPSPQGRGLQQRTP